MGDPLQEVRADVAGHMDEIKRYFKPGAKVTVMVRFPGHPTRDFMMTDDDLSGLREMLDRSAERETVSPQAHSPQDDTMKGIDP